MKHYYYTSVLSVAGSDSGGGAGIQADLKTFGALGCYGTTAITAITVQNTLGVHQVAALSSELVSAQMNAVLSDIKPSAIKIGMLPDSKMVEAIVMILRNVNVPVVFDPVLRSGSGAVFSSEETKQAFTEMLFPLCTLVTPNTLEAAKLTGLNINDVDEMKKAAHLLLKTGCKAVLVTGGHLKGEKLHDVLVEKSGRESVFTSSFIESKNLHGTGCTLSAAIAAFMAKGRSIPSAVAEAIEYVQGAIQFGKDVLIGKDVGPLNHFYNPQNTVKNETR